MDERDYKAMNEELKQPSCLGDVTCRKIQELNTKNESKKEYSLGDVMLLDKWEKQLEVLNYTRTEIEAMSPSFYGR